MSDEQLRMVEKVRKLLALSKSSNEHEAKLAAQRASEIMEKYQIEFADVVLAATQSAEIIREHFEVPDQKMKLLWLETLGHACAVLFDASILVNRELHGTSFTFVGFKDDIELAKALFQHLYSSWFGIVERDLTKYRNDAYIAYHRHLTPKETMKFKHGHGQGFAYALYVRCKTLSEERKARVQAASNTCTALIVLKGQKVEQYISRFKSIKKKQTSGSYEGQAAGVKAGQNIPLGGAVGTHNNQQLKG